jgi:hypothetical protein
VGARLSFFLSFLLSCFHVFQASTPMLMFGIRKESALFFASSSDAFISNGQCGSKAGTNIECDGINRNTFVSLPEFIYK